MMTTLTISPQGQITLPAEVLSRDAWKNNPELVLLSVGDMVVLRPAYYLKNDDISGLGGFFANNAVHLSTEELCESVSLKSV
ncbi:MAG: AbrB/MazE/SpoVT family DNA-binding domain-containing protein [Methylovulum sp.]|nr:AbrB/MazE/SpoVT family DNA-binding domain-containing protein [Methylovulum sp.]